MSFEAEQAVIGCLMLDAEAKEEISLTPEMFEDGLLGKVFFEITTSETQVDPIILRSKISPDEIPDDVLYRVLNECASKAAVSGQISEYADIVRADYIKRAIGKAVTPDASVDEIIGRLEKLTYNKRKTITAETLVDEYSKKVFTDKKEVGFDTGYFDLDLKLGGMFRGDVCVIGARPSVGKSAFVIEMILQMAKKGYKVTLFSLEMTNEQVYNRILAHESGITINRIKRATSYNGQEEKYVDKANEAIRGLKERLEFYDDVYKVEDMKRLARGRDVIVVDYAQLVSPTGEYKGNRYAEVGAISHAFKHMAKKLNIAVVLLSQLNRVSEQTETKEPNMSELREGGDFEQDASQILMLWNKNEERTRKGIKIEKNRDGALEKFEYDFDGATCHFFKPIVVDNPFEV